MSEDEGQQQQHSDAPHASSRSHINTIMGDQKEETATAIRNPNLGSEKPALGTLDTIDHPRNRGRQGSADEQLLAEALQRSLRVEKTTGTSGLTTEQSGIADVVTPPSHELSPGMLNNLRGSSSPSYSQVSVGSIGPTTLPGLPPPRTYDLTPVTRNTSGEYAGAAPVTPGEFLHGELLALPADLNEEAPVMPPLKMTVSKPPIVANGLPPEGNEEPLLPSAAVEFPARKFYSFTTREQYEEEVLKQVGTYDLSDDDEDDEDDVDRAMVQPYAPRQRRDNFDIESLPDEELQQIFCTGSDESSTTQHRLAALPLEGRIPSLHLANHLNGSTTSFTSYHTDGDEDEDSLVHIHGDTDDCESLSSSTSNKHSSHDDDEDDPIRRKLRKRKQLLKEERAVEWLQSLDSSQVAEAASSKFLTQPPQVALPRKEAFDLKRITSTPAGHP